METDGADDRSVPDIVRRAARDERKDSQVSETRHDQGRKVKAHPILSNICEHGKERGGERQRESVPVSKGTSFPAEAKRRETHPRPPRLRIVMSVEPESEEVAPETWGDGREEGERAGEGVEEDHVRDGSEG